MPTEFPGNSNKEKENRRQPAKPQKKVVKVVQGEVHRRKKPLGKRIKEFFFRGDSSVWSFVALDILLPATKDAISDAFKEGIDYAMWGGDSRPGRRDGRHRRDGRGHVRYDRYSSRHDEPRNMSRRDRASHNFDDIVLDSRVEAQHVIDRLFDLANQFEVATVADLYELVGVTANYTDDKWGWEDLRGAGVTRLSSGGYLLDLPRPEPLD